MSSLEAALAQVGEIEAAVAAGDLDLANVATQNLKPLLVDRGIEDILQLKTRIENLAIGVKALRARDGASLKKLNHQRGGAAAYQQIQGGA